MSNKRDAKSEVEQQDTPRKKKSKSDRNHPVLADVNSVYTTQTFKEGFGEAFRKHAVFEHGKEYQIERNTFQTKQTKPCRQ